MARYAEGTTVPVEQTMAEIRGLLARHGATAFGTMEGTDGDGQFRALIQFVLGGLPYRFDVARPSLEELKDDYRRRGMGVQGERQADWPRRLAAEWRRRWRARLLWLKATLEFAEGEHVDEVGRVLLPYLLLPDGRTTLYEQAQRELPVAFAEGRAPLLMLTGGG